jgi:hypothetical protein
MLVMTTIKSIDEDHIKLLASIIDFRCEKLKQSYKLLSADLENLYKSHSKRSQDKICLNIAIKMDFIEILLSKIIDDITLIEIIEYDKNNQIKPPRKEDNIHYQ